MSPNSTYIDYALALGVGLAAGLVTTPAVRALSRRIGFVDKPDGGRKTHTSAVALGGGLAVFVSMMAAIAVTFAFARTQGLDILNFNDDRADRAVLLGLLQASVFTLVLGLIDDRFAIRGRYKLLGQVGIVAWLVSSGLTVDKFGFFGQEVHLGVMAAPLTALWLLITINAINLIDGIDGLASSVGVVLCLTVAAITGMLGHFAEAVVVISLAGALLGFLRYNFAPASIYLGDTGSMLVGLVIGAIAAHTSVKSPAAIAMAVPLAVWSIPILDSGAAILRRKLTGRSLFAADRGHLHHSLLVRGWTVRQASMFITLICATTCLSALLSMLWGNDLIALVMVGAVALFLISTKTFGHIEFALIKRRLGDSIAAPRGDASASRQSAIRLQGSREWDKLWEALVESADGHGLIKMKLEINIPSLHEVYFGDWKTTRKLDPEATDRSWSVSHPLLVAGEAVGGLELAGLPDPERGSTPGQLIQVLDFLEPIEEDVRRIRERIEDDHSLAEGSNSVIVPSMKLPGGKTAFEKPTDALDSAPTTTPH